MAFHVVGPNEGSNPVTKADRRRLDIIHRLPCVACVQEGLAGCGPVEAHHVVHNGYRRLSGGHQSTLPLGAWHHRAEPFDRWTKREMESCYGPSLATSKREFVKRYGTELELLERVNAIIG